MAPTKNGKNAPIAEETSTPDLSTTASLTIAAAAKLADVTPQTMRNAVKLHKAFKSDGAVVLRKMRDEFGNETEHDTTYVTPAAVQLYIDAKANGDTRTRGENDPIRQIIRLTTAEIAAYKAGDYATAFARKPELESAAPKRVKQEATSEGEQPNTSTDEAQPSTSDQPGLFDVLLEEQEAITV